ncbi:MAG: DEAD/DEAH box helicase [Treponema sp.]|jgi:superfamily II DNA/RNA helicase|nr:DEAD/DEAH box helicase [Treponema sp.]
MENMENFTALGLAPFFVTRLGERNIHKPTDIQLRVIPELLEGRSAAFCSATGTGKTFAYLLPLFQRLFSGGSPAAGAGPALLILAPTYELCSQIRTEAEFLLRDFTPDPPAVSLLTGAGSLKRQIEALKKDRPAVVVGNPGRILLLAGMGKLRFGALRSLVFDEGDRLVAEDLRGETLELLGLITGARKGPGLVCAACSATLSAKNREPLLPFMGKDISVIETPEQEILRERIQHWAIWSEGRRKIETLRSLLAAVKPKKALVFSGRSWDAAKITSRLTHLPAAALYGGMEKNRRRDAIGGFRSGKITVLVSSDLAARGLDIPEISHVIALDVPQDAGAYTHRAGRTGRAGKRGIMVSIGDEAEMRRLALLEKRLGLTVYPKELYQGRITTPGEE